MKRVRLIVHSDYLCPWCYNAAVRLRRIQEEFGDAVEIEWRAFLLRPRPRDEDGDDERALERFVRYTQSWLRPAAEPDAARFRVWEGGEGPPSHSVPPHRVAKAAATLGRAEFERLHERLLAAYFQESRDITRRPVLEALWGEAGLPAESFAQSDDPATLEATWSEYRDAVERGITGVPAAYVEGQEPFLLGAQPLELYRRWIARNLAT